jgi:hypothetical protein
MLNERLQERSNVAGQRFSIDIMLFRKVLENFADAAGLGKHAPDFGRDPIEVEIRAGIQVQNDSAAIDVGCGQFPIPYQDAVDCDAQAAGLHCAV